MRFQRNCADEPDEPPPRRFAGALRGLHAGDRNGIVRPRQPAGWLWSVALDRPQSLLADWGLADSTSATPKTPGLRETLRPGHTVTVSVAGWLPQGWQCHPAPAA